jgi:outer membrane protein TolC
MNRQCLLVAAAAMLLAALPVSAQRTDTLRLSVEDAVATALQNSDEVRLAAARVDVADAQFGTARASALPQLRINSSYNHAFANARGQAVGQVFNQPNTYNVNLSVSQTLFQGGRIVAAARAAGDTRRASRLDESEAKAQLTIDVQRAYLDVLFASRYVELQSNNVTLAASRLSQVEQLQRAGRAARYDVLRARVEHANLEPLLIQARNDRELALLDLKRLLNIPLERQVELTTRVDTSGVRTMLASLQDTTVAPDRATIRAAELNVHARRAGITVARADFLPTAAITFNTGYQAFPPRGFGFPDRFGQAANEFCAPGASPTQQCQNGGWFSDRSLNLQFSVPIFDGFRAKSNLELARAQEQLAEAQLQQTREQVALEVARARAELARARAMFEARQQTSAEAQEAFQLASLRFDRGLSTQLEVSDAQVALLTAQSVEARATYDLYLASAELARALGRPIPLPPSAQGPSIRRSDDGAK